MQLYSFEGSTIARISSLIMSELFPACSSCRKKFNLSQSSSGSDDKNVVFEMPEAMIAGDFSNFIRFCNSFFIFSEVFFFVSVTGSNTFFYSHGCFVHLNCLVILLHLLGFVTKLTLLVFSNLLYF